MERKSEKEKIVQVCRIFQYEGLFDGFGHITWRVSENEILSTPKMPPGFATEEDIIHLNLSGNKTQGDKSPNAETPLHLAIYESRSDVHCIVHYHTSAVIALTAANKEVLPVCNAGVFFYEGTPIYDDPSLLTTIEQGREVAAVLGKHCAVLLRGHGAIVVADNIENLCRLGVNLEKTARIQILAESLGEIKIHSPETAEKLKKVEESEGAIRRFWAYYEKVLQL